MKKALPTIRAGREYHVRGVFNLRKGGVGFDPRSEFPGHLGLHSMRESVTRLGGGLQIESAQGKGTRIHLRLPASVEG